MKRTRKINGEVSNAVAYAQGKAHGQLGRNARPDFVKVGVIESYMRGYRAGLKLWKREVKRKPARRRNSLFTAATTRAAKQVKKIKRTGARRVVERDTQEGGEIIGAAPGGFVKVKWDNRERPTLIKRSEIKRYPYVRNPTADRRRQTIKKIKNNGLMELAGGVQALEYLTSKAGPERKRKRNLTVNPSVAPYTLQTDMGQRVAGEWWTKAAALKVAQRYANETGKMFWVYKTNRAGSMLPSSRVFPKKGKLNPSVRSMSQRFQGSASGQTEEFYFSDSAPRLDFSRGGKFVFIKLKGTMIRVANSVVAIDPVTEKLWLGTKNQAGMFKRKAHANERLDYGEVDEVCYLTAKKHIGNGRLFEYHHRFGEEGGKKPTLLVDHEGMPILKGGDYTIESRGIVN